MKALVDKFGVWLDFDFCAFYQHRSFLEKLVMTVQYPHDYKTDLLANLSIFPSTSRLFKAKMQEKIDSLTDVCVVTLVIL